MDGRYQAREPGTQFRRQELSSRIALFRRRQQQGLWRRSAAPARARLRGSPHPDGLSPAWPLKYDAFEPYYQAAEELYHVHGLRGEDPTEPPALKALRLSAAHPRTAHPAAVRRAQARRPQAVPSAGGGAAGRAGRQAAAAFGLHPLQRVRRLSVPHQRQGRRAGHLRGSRTARASQPHAAHPLVRAAAGHRPRRRTSPLSRSSSDGVAPAATGRHGGGGVRRTVLGAADAALGQRPVIRTASPTARGWSGATTCATTTRW